MKKTLLTIAVAALTLAGVNAKAADRIQQPLWTCALNFAADGGGVQFLVGSFKLTGPGKIRCLDIAGNTQELDVKVTLGSTPIAPNFAIGHFNLNGIAAGIGVASGPKAILGKYYSLSGQAAAIVGVGANLALHGGAEAITLNLGVNVVRGAGIQVGLNRIMIEEAN